MMINPDKQTYAVAKEFDVVVLRQAIREVARSLELSLVQQARVTAAISDIARNVVIQHWTMNFAISVNPVGLRRALDVRCQSPDHQPHPSCGELESLVSMDSARQLLDEASLDEAGDPPTLTLRIWI